MTPIGSGDVNTNVTAISGGAITTGTVAAARIDVANIVIGNLSGASSFKGGLSNLENPSSSLTPIGSGDVNGNVTEISGGVITTGTINANRINIDGVTLDTDGSDQLIIKDSGVDSPQIKSNALGTIKGDSDANISATQFSTQPYTLFIISSPFHKHSGTLLQEIGSVTFTTPLTTADSVDYLLTFEANASGTFSSSSQVMIVSHVQRTNTLGQSYDSNATRSGDFNQSIFSAVTGTSSGQLLRIAKFQSLRGGSTVFLKLYGFQRSVTGTQEWDGIFISGQALSR